MPLRRRQALKVISGVLCIVEEGGGGHGGLPAHRSAGETVNVINTTECCGVPSSLLRRLDLAQVSPRGTWQALRSF